MNFRVATLLEVMLVTTTCILLLKYIFPLGLVLISTYASARLVARAVRKGETRTLKLAKVGAFWGITATWTFGLVPVAFIISRRLLSEEPVLANDVQWAMAILIGFVAIYGTVAAVVGAMVGTCSGAYLSRYARRGMN